LDALAYSLPIETKINLFQKVIKRKQSRHFRQNKTKLD